MQVMPTLCSIDTHFDTSKWTAFENIMGKGEIAQFLLFLLSFLLNQIIVSPCVHIFDVISVFAAEFAYEVKGYVGNCGLIFMKLDQFVFYHQYILFLEDLAKL